MNPAVSKVLDGAVYVAANVAIAAPFGLLGALMVWAFLQPDPVQEAKGREAHAELLERLQADEQRCVDETLLPVRVAREATDAEVADAHRWCDRTSAWR
jgi:hypothetical protein